MELGSADGVHRRGLGSMGDVIVKNIRRVQSHVTGTSAQLIQFGYKLHTNPSCNQNIPSRSGTCNGRTAEPLGRFADRGGGGPAALKLSLDLGRGGRTGVEGTLESPRESDGRRIMRDVGVVGRFTTEGKGEGGLGECGVRDSEGGGITGWGGTFEGIDADNAFGY